MIEDDRDYRGKTPIGSKYHRKDYGARPGVYFRGEMRYRGNSTMAPRKTHCGKGKTLRDHRN